MHLASWEAGTARSLTGETTSCWQRRSLSPPDPFVVLGIIEICVQSLNEKENGRREKERMDCNLLGEWRVVRRG